MATPGYAPYGLTGDGLIDATTHGFKWVLNADRTLDWSLSAGLFGETWSSTSFMVTELTQILNIFSVYANIKFNYVGSYSSPQGAAAAGAELNFAKDSANYLFSKPAQWAMGFFNPQINNLLYNGAVGDIYVNGRSEAAFLPSYDPGSSGWFMFMHEIGHTLGLKHPHDDGGTGHPLLSQVNLGAFDEDWATMMSYNDDFEWNRVAWEPATPMILDVLALQYLYGPNPNTRAGDSLLELSSVGAYLTVWDASGNDTVAVGAGEGGWFIVLPQFQLSSLVATKAGYALPDADNYLPSPRTLYWLAGDMENARGGNGGDTIYGSNGSNDLEGGYGNDTVHGEGGDDLFDWDPAQRYGNDVFYGGLGNDTFVLDSTNDQVIEYASEGTDTIWVAFNASLVNYPNVENISSNANFGVTLTGNSGNNELRGSAFNDTLDGGAGTDTAYYAGNRAQFTVSQSGGITTVTGTGAGTDQLRNIEFLRFNDQTLALTNLDTTPPSVLTFSPPDEATGVSATANIQLTFSETITRGTGSIVLKNAAGTIIETFDAATSAALSISGTSLIINPTKDLASGTGYSIEFPGGSIKDTAGNSWAGTTSYNFTTAAVAQTITGTAGVDKFTGTTANEVFNMLAGNDLVVGSSGNDTIDGGSGYDLVDYSSAPNAVSVNLATGVASKGSLGTDKLISIESVYGSTYNDSLTGSAADEAFEALEGNDTIDGGAGFDAANYFYATGPITANLATGAVTGSQGNDSLVNIEDIEGSPYNDILVGSDRAENLGGWGGNDSISGGGGNDALLGGSGNDSLDGGSGIDIDYLDGSRTNYVITRTASGLIVTDTKGGTGTDNLTSVERLYFADSSLAMDMAIAEAGGKTVLAMAATLGPAFVSSQSYAGLFLHFFDSGASLLSGAQLLVDTGIVAAFAGGADNASFVKFVYGNVYGQAPDAATLANLVAPLNAHTTTQAQWMADMMASSANQAHVGLAGYVGTGLAFI